jgi:hypothetical protein
LSSGESEKAEAFDHSHSAYCRTKDEERVVELKRVESRITTENEGRKYVNVTENEIRERDRKGSLKEKKARIYRRTVCERERTSKNFVFNVSLIEKPNLHVSRGLYNTLYLRTTFLC